MNAAATRHIRAASYFVLLVGNSAVAYLGDVGGLPGLTLASASMLTLVLGLLVTEPAR